MRVGLVGAGKISGQYLDYLDTHGAAAGLELTAVADLDRSRAEQVADGRPGTRVLTVAELCAAPDVDVVLNLTVPAAHASVAHAALAHGKHVHGEKPLAATREEAMAVLAAAGKAGVLVGCAPDTVLGRGLQTARAVVDGGLIGEPVAATAFFTCAGHDWHPDPAFLYAPGAGPLLDMGPYYLTSLVHLLGPVRSVLGASSRSGAERTVGSGPRRGESFPVLTDTHVTGVLQHERGALSTVVMSFEIHAARLPRIEVYGTDGSVSVPDPNWFEGQVELLTAEDPTWRAVPPAQGYAEAGRGIGLADLARAARDGTPQRCSGEVALHVLDVMESLLEAAKGGGRAEVTTTCRRPAAVPEGALVREA